MYVAIQQVKGIDRRYKAGDFIRDFSRVIEASEVM